ncbi:G-protein coupled receptor [Biomphalaria glabrata]|nr:G-protein coupled receptor [Biomphalaria glabrata]
MSASVHLVFLGFNESQRFLNLSSNETSQDSLPDIELIEIDKILRLLQLCIKPVVGAFGLFVNTLTLIILCKMGLKKASNILILNLTLADCLILMNSVNFVHLLARFGHDTISFDFYGWELSGDLAGFVFILDRLSNSLHYWGSYVSTGIPVLITLERFIATFFPLKFKQIVTPKRVFILNVAIWLIWLPWILSWSLLYTFVSSKLPNGQLITKRIRATFFIKDIYLYSLIDVYVLNFLSSIIPVCLVCLGCLCIGIRLKLFRRERKLLATSSTRSSMRTTRTLVSVSLIFSVINGCYFIVGLLFSNLNTTSFITLVDELMRLMLNICSTSNFFVYVILNSKFRRILINMITLRT